MRAIAAVDKNWGIGKDNRLLVSIPEDMKFFRETTAGHVVVMGRKTLQSFPGGRPLKNRVNIVLTRDPDFRPEGVTVVHTEEELLSETAKYAPEEIFIIGGESIYRQFAHLCEMVYITKVSKEFAADAFFPNLDESPLWVVESESELKEYEDMTYRFVTYKRKTDLPEES